jgi:hypothetical protein
MLPGLRLDETGPSAKPCPPLSAHKINDDVAPCSVGTNSRTIFSQGRILRRDEKPQAPILFHQQGVRVMSGANGPRLSQKQLDVG